MSTNDTPTGLDRAPDRYSSKGRETIDRMRDAAYPLAEQFLGKPGKEADALADAMFAYHCNVTALKYEDRLGLKDAPEQDAKKAYFYRTMASHVLSCGLLPDPRHERPGFVPYKREPVEGDWSPHR